MAAMLRLRLRGPSGKQVVHSADPSATLADFLKDVALKLGEDERIEMLFGYPLTLCLADSNTQIGSLVASGDALAFQRLPSPVAPTHAERSLPAHDDDPSRSKTGDRAHAVLRDPPLPIPPNPL